MLAELSADVPFLFFSTDLVFDGHQGNYGEDDAVNPLSIATWWADRTGGTVGTRPGADFAWVEGAAGFPFMYWVFNPVPEPKTVKNRVHWDVKLADASIDDLVDAGARLLRMRDGDIDWCVMADPEGNEFCAFA